MPEVTVEIDSKLGSFTKFLYSDSLRSLTIISEQEVPMDTHKMSQIHPVNIQSPPSAVRSSLHKDLKVSGMLDQHTAPKMEPAGESQSTNSATPPKSEAGLTAAVEIDRAEDGRQSPISVYTQPSLSTMGDDRLASLEREAALLLGASSDVVSFPDERQERIELAADMGSQGAIAPVSRAPPLMLQGTYGTAEFGTPGTLQYRMLLTNKDKQVLSSWDNIPLTARPKPNTAEAKMSDEEYSIIHCVNKTAKRTWAKFELEAGEEWHPLRISRRAGGPAHFLENVDWNVGMLPQTTAEPGLPNDTYGGVPYAEGPLEIVDLSPVARATGEIFQQKVLGAFLVVDPNSATISWKVIGVDANCKLAGQLTEIDDLEAWQPGGVMALKEWLKTGECLGPEDKAKVLGLGSKSVDSTRAREIVAEAHISWKVRYYKKHTSATSPGGISQESEAVESAAAERGPVAEDYKDIWLVNTCREYSLQRIPLADKSEGASARYQRAWSAVEKEDTSLGRIGSFNFTITTDVPLPEIGQHNSEREAKGMLPPGYALGWKHYKANHSAPNVFGKKSQDIPQPEVYSLATGEDWKSLVNKSNLWEDDSDRSKVWVKRNNQNNSHSRASSVGAPVGSSPLCGSSLSGVSGRRNNSDKGASRSSPHSPLDSKNPSRSCPHSPKKSPSCGGNGQPTDYPDRLQNSRSSDQDRSSRNVDIDFDSEPTPMDWMFPGSSLIPFSDLGPSRPLSLAPPAHEGHHRSASASIIWDEDYDEQTTSGQYESGNYSGTPSNSSSLHKRALSVLMAGWSKPNAEPVNAIPETSKPYVAVVTEEPKLSRSRCFSPFRSNDSVQKSKSSSEKSPFRWWGNSDRKGSPAKTLRSF